jgi:phosphorylcholine phosphatase
MIRLRTLLLSLSLALIFAGTAGATELKHWPAAAKTQLEALIKTHANSGAYAVFDWDQTSARWDLEESLLPFLEMKGVLTREKLDPSLKLVPFKDSDGQRESLNSYYQRLCEIDDMVCYPWVAQVFSGFTLAELKQHVDQLLAYDKLIPATYFEGSVVKQAQIHPQRVYPGQQELFHKLMENGIEVYIVSAAHEELVRMVASDPKYGYDVKPQNVIGVTTLLKNRKSGALTTARKQIAEGSYNQAANLELEVQPYLWTPATWMAGKHAAILTFIDEWKKPILVAGDTPTSDGYMLFHATDVERGGVRLWVDRKAAHLATIRAAAKRHAASQAALGQPVTAERNWIVVKPEELE